MLLVGQDSAVEIFCGYHYGLGLKLKAKSNLRDAIY